MSKIVSGRVKPCAVDGCDKPAVGRRMCSTHSSRLYKHGSTDDPRRTPEQRFWAKVDRRDDRDCWLWTGSLLGGGYGEFMRGKRKLAHRFAYELLVGSIPEGMQLDHLCRVRHCVNPAHLEPVTSRENTMRGANHVAQQALRTHCPLGHEYTPENTEQGRKGRTCRACRQIRRAKGRVS